MNALDPILAAFIFAFVGACGLLAYLEDKDWW